ncbi:MAG TPA: hypothetical protein VFF55_08575, partial [Candidatus Deferrimicrobium sp.]|nr:hypothetical protein [Candidatus Deferrimicrobium sp.]
IVQLLEGGAASATMSPDVAVARLREAGGRLAISDVCIGWGLPLPLVEAVAGEAQRQGAALWLWHPLLSGDGRYMPGADRALGRAGVPVDAPGGMGEFTFDCPVRTAALDAALLRLDEAAARHPWHGIFLDKIRWPSPSRDPSADLACFCAACHDAAAREGIDLEAVSAWLAHAARSPGGRISLVTALLQGGEDERLDHFLAWRCQRITAALNSAAERVASHRDPDGQPMHVALDVFAPSLARAVGQDISLLAPRGEFTKAMLYLGTHGPAGMSFELCRLAGWLATGDVPSPVGLLSDLLAFPLPEMEILCSGSLGSEVFDAELAALRRLAGPGAAAGIDAVAIDGLAVLPDAVLEEVVGEAARAGVPVVLSWDLMAIPEDRLARLASRLSRAA